MKLNRAIIPVLTFLAVEMAGANTITVTSTNDSGPGTLRDALASANNGDTIDATGVSGAIQLSGQLLVSTSVAILGPGSGALEVEGGGGRVFHISPGQNVTIAGLTIANGHATGSFPTNAGGGILNDHATLTVSNCVVGPNQATYGGGIYNFGEYYGNGSVTVINSSVSNNESVYEGGGIYNDSEYNADGGASLTVTNSTLSENHTYTSSYGGGIYNDAYAGKATVTVIASTLGDENLAHWGGAIYNYAEQGIGSVTVSASTLKFNRAAYGGGIYNYGEYYGIGSVTVINSTFSFNSVGDGGGAIYNDGEGSEASASVTVNLSTFSDNSANGAAGTYHDGGCIFNDGSNFGNARTQIGNTILNAGESGANLANLQGVFTSAGYNLSSDAGDGLLTATSDLINTNPMLGPLQDNGGPTLTYALLPGSPAIDAGDPGFTPPPYFDQRGLGFQRVVNGRIDIGAFEVQTAGAPTLYISDSGNTVTVYWQNVSGWSLQQNNNLAIPANWSASGGVTTTNGTNYLNLASPTGNLFFRLKQ